MRRHILREISSKPNAVQLSKNRSSLREPPSGPEALQGRRQGERWVEVPVLSEPFVPSTGSGRTVSRRAQHEREDLQCLYNYGPINN